MEMEDIVIVTRSDDISRVLSRVLEKDGYGVTIAQTVEDFLIKYRGKKPRLIIFDISPPYSETLKECRRIKMDPNTRDVPLITLFSAVWQRDKREVFKNTCADSFLNKPFSLKEFRKTVYSWV
jgi:CheY-like chemotaxis protein